MADWNVVVTVRPRRFNRAIVALRRYGVLWETGLYNVVAMSVADVYDFLDEVRDHAAEDELFDSVSHIFPVTRQFQFTDPEDFEQQARAVVTEWAPRLEGKSFHVRMHRRGFKGQLHSTHEERLLGHVVLDALEQAGAAEARIDWEDPEVIISVETIRDRAGMALWPRDELERYPFLLASIEPRAARAHESPAEPAS